MKIHSLSLFTLGLVGLVAAAATPRSAAADALPTVDLGYGVYQASINDTGAYYNFSNIRYAEPPTGNLRFAAPVPPQGRNRTVTDGGQVPVTCPQSVPEWILAIEAAALGVSVSTLLAELEVGGDTATEDCLFLDVMVPESIFNQRDCVDYVGAPVTVWIYGGGFTLGYKSEYEPAGLIAQSQTNGAEGMIFVAMNYRLGMFGWLSGPTFQEESGTGNAGLWDQRLALEWVQTYIRHFGGDPNRVTVIGESAGGSSVLHQITAYGGVAKAPFQQAISQSPAYLPIGSNTLEDNLFESILEYASFVTNSSITSLLELRELPTAVLQEINFLAVWNSPYGQFTFGPMVDGDFVPALPGVLLKNGKFDQSLKIMVGHNSDEGDLFTPPYVTNETAFDAFIRTYQIPAASDTVVEYVETILYPPVFNGTYSYTTEFERISLLIAESVITCNTRYLNLAFKNETYAYLFDIPPGLHGVDLSYTFYNGYTSTLDDSVAVNGTTAIAFQDYIIAFVLTGNPNGAERPDFPMYGADSIVLNIDYDLDGATRVDPVANSRCAWWQEGLFA